MSEATKDTLGLNIALLGAVIAIFYLMNRVLPWLEKKAAMYFVYKRYPLSYQQECTCGHTRLYHEGEDEQCVRVGCWCRGFNLQDMTGRHE